MSCLPITVIATLGPSSCSPAAVAALREAGADLVRLNGSHLRPGQLLQLLDIAGKGGFPPERVVLDLQGGKTRLGWLDKPVPMSAGQRIHLVPAGAAPPTAGVLPVDRPAFLRALSAGDRLRVDDGRLGLKVLAVHGTRVTVEAEQDGELLARKGLARMGEDLDLEVHVLPSDRTLLDAALGRGVQALAVSYARNPDLLRLVRRHARNAAPDSAVRVYAKIEQPAAIDAWKMLADSADALWLCRGDLGAEVGLEHLPALQRRLLSEALPDTPLFVAGQVLHHLTASPRPTRSEACHVADLVVAGAAGFVLSDETAMGPHGPAAVRWIRKLAAAAHGAGAPS